MVKGLRTDSYCSGDVNLQDACACVSHVCEYQGLLYATPGVIRTCDIFYVLGVLIYCWKLPDAEGWLLCIFSETLKLSAG